MAGDGVARRLVTDLGLIAWTLGERRARRGHGVELDALPLAAMVTLAAVRAARLDPIEALRHE